MNEFPYQEPYPMGGTNGDPEPRLKCKDCGWMGDAQECKHYVPVYEKQGVDVVREDRCPVCNGVNLRPIGGK